jgi:hypothetical protein
MPMPMPMPTPMQVPPLSCASWRMLLVPLAAASRTRSTSPPGTRLPTPPGCPSRHSSSGEQCGGAAVAAGGRGSQPRSTPTTCEGIAAAPAAVMAAETGNAKMHFDSCPASAHRQTHLMGRCMHHLSSTAILLVSASLLRGKRSVLHLPQILYALNRYVAIGMPSFLIVLWFFFQTKGSNN